jgi:hypothetical protein
MRLYPPWKWLTKELPPDGEPIWFVRFGAPEPPILGTYEALSKSFLSVIDGETFIFFPMVVLKWRLVTP